MWWYGRGNSGGSWLPEQKKANMWHGRGNSGGSWPPAFPRSQGKAFKPTKNCEPNIAICFQIKFIHKDIKVLLF